MYELQFEEMGLLLELKSEIMETYIQMMAALSCEKLNLIGLEQIQITTI